MLKDILEKVKNDENNLKLIEKSSDILIDIHGHDLANDYLSLEEDEKTLLLKILPLESISDLLIYLPKEDAVNTLINNFDDETKIEIINLMPVDDAVDFLQEYPEKNNKSFIIKHLKYSKKIKDLIVYEDDEVGAYMTTQFIKLNENWDLKIASKELVRNAPQSETITTLFVVDNQDKFIGTLPLKKLIKSQMPMLISDIVEKDIPTVLNTSDIEEAANDLNNYNLLALPVIDEENHLLGILTLDDIIDVYEEEAQEDFEKLASIPDTEISKNDSPFIQALKRLPWLIILLILNIPNTLLSESIGAPLAGIAILVVLQPLMLDSPGNVATQTLALTLVKINKEGKLKLKDFIKESLSGFFTAIIMGIFSFAVAFVFILIFTKINPSSLPSTKPAIQNMGVINYSLMFAGISGISILIILMFSPLLGMIIPLTLKLIKIDPATASGPFITTLSDIISVGIYFGIAQLLLRIGGLL